MDYSHIVVALIMTAGTVIAQVALSFRSNNVIMYRLDVLEKKQDKHNSVMERMCVVETKLQKIDEKISEERKCEGK